MSLAYRGLDYAAERRWSDAAEALGRSRAPAAYERRVGRVLGGLVGTVSGLMLFASALSWADFRPTGSVSLVTGLFGAGAASVVAYLVGRLAARLHARRVLGRVLVRSGDAVADLASLEVGSPGHRLQRMAIELEHRSVLLPMLALSLLAPLTLHGLVAGLLGTIGSFDSWIRASALVVGHAHLVLCICCVRYASVIRGSTTEQLRMRGDRDWGRALAFTTVTAAVPGLVLMAAPPVLTLVTGLVFIPAMFKMIRSAVESERSALAD